MLYSDCDCDCDCDCERVAATPLSVPPSTSRSTCCEACMPSAEGSHSSRGLRRGTTKPMGAGVTSSPERANSATARGM